MKQGSNRAPHRKTPWGAALLLLGLLSPMAANAQALTDAGIPNQVHKKNLGKIVWSNESISFTDPDESKFKTSFAATDYLWGRIFLEKSPQRTIQEMTGEIKTSLSFYYDLYVDGVKNSWLVERGDWVTEAHLARTSQQVWLYVNKEGKERDVANWSKILSGLKPGTHEIRVDLKVESASEEVSKKVFASGSFQIIKKAGDKLKIGKSFSDYKAGMQDAALNAQIMENLKNWGKSQNWPETFKKVKIASTDWDIIRNSLGIILKRTVTAYGYSTTPDGFSQVQSFVFRQDYDGAKYAKAVKFDGVVPNSQDMVDGE